MVLVYLFQNRGWLRRLLITLMLISFSPLIQSGFLLFTEPNQRWWYMLNLLCVLATALVPYLIGCAYIVLSLLKVDSLAVPMRLVSWVVASPYWPCILPWTHTFDRLTGAVAAVLMISPFVMPLVTFAGYMQGPKLWAKSEKAMAEGKRRAKAKSRVVRKKRVPRSQRPEI